MQILRRGHHRETIAALDEILRRLPSLESIAGAPHSLELYRGVGHGKSVRIGKRRTLRSVIEEFPAGTVFRNGQENRFHSWTPEAGIARGFTFNINPLSPRRGFILRLRDHRIANYVGGFNRLYRERDFLMPPGTGDLIVTGHSIERHNLVRWPILGQADAVVVDVEWSNPDDPFQVRSSD